MQKGGGGCICGILQYNALQVLSVRPSVRVSAEVDAVMSWAHNACAWIEVGVVPDKHSTFSSTEATCMMERCTSSISELVAVGQVLMITYQASWAKLQIQRCEGEPPPVSHCTCTFMFCKSINIMNVGNTRNLQLIDTAHSMAV